MRKFFLLIVMFGIGSVTITGIFANELVPYVLLLFAGIGMFGYMVYSLEKYGEVVDDAVARDFRTISEDAVIAHFRIMRNMHALHEEIVVANHRLSSIVCGTVDDHILAYDVVVADDTLALLPHEFEILRQRGNHRPLVDFVVVSHPCPVEDACKGEDDAVVADFHIPLYIHEGKYLTVVAYFRPGVDFGSWTDITWHS